MTWQEEQLSMLRMELKLGIQDLGVATDNDKMHLEVKRSVIHIFSGDAVASKCHWSQKK